MCDVTKHCAIQTCMQRAQVRGRGKTSVGKIYLCLLNQIRLRYFTFPSYLSHWVFQFLLYAADSNPNGYAYPNIMFMYSPKWHLWYFSLRYFPLAICAAMPWAHTCQWLHFYIYSPNSFWAQRPHTCSTAFLTSLLGYPPHPRHCDRLNKSPQYVHAPIPGTYRGYLIWQKRLYKCGKLRVSRVYPGLFGWDRWVREEGNACDNRSKDLSEGAPNQGILAGSRSWRMDSPFESPEGSNLSNALILAPCDPFQTSDVPNCKIIKLMAICYTGNGKLIQAPQI